MPELEETPLNFIEQIIEKDIQNGKWNSTIKTRFPPEPNGFLHIGHVQAIILNYDLAKKYGGKFHLRFDDTNPEKEEKKFVDSIKEDIKWLGADWEDSLFFASDYFQDLYHHAISLIEKGKAYVCHLNPEEFREYRGTLTEKGKDSPFRNRTIEENLTLIDQMKTGVFAEGECCVRAKIDMKSPNINLRDPVLYRIKKVTHHRSKDRWVIYPMYDFTHPLSDSKEGITHSICTLEFEDHRPLYDWFCQQLEIHHPQQIEFARLFVEYTVTSKRKLLALIEDLVVDDWDDPRLPTVSGMRRRGYTAKALRKFCRSVGVTKKNSSISLGTLEAHVRDHLNEICHRRLSVLHPLKVTIANWEAGHSKEIEVENHPLDPKAGTRTINLSQTIFIDRDDFMEEPPNNKWRRLKPGGMVRLRYGPIIKCNDIIKNSEGEIAELMCEYVPDSFAGVTPEGIKKVKGIIGWVDGETSVDAELRLYNHLFTDPTPDRHKEKDFRDFINPNSLEVVQGLIEGNLKNAKIGEKFQFERLGYFRVDEDSHPQKLVFNRIITLKDSFGITKPIS